MPNIGGKRLAGDLVTGIKAAVSRAMDESKLQIAAGITELVTEIREGTNDVVHALRVEADGVREEFAELVGNAERAADDAVTDAKKLTANGDAQKSA